MSVLGSGAALTFLSRLLFGPAHFVDHVHARPQPNGSIKYQFDIRKDTIKSSWKGCSNNPRFYHEDAAKNNEFVRRHTLVPVESIEKATILCDGYRILPVNEDGHIVLTGDRVLDPKTKQELLGRDMRIRGYLTMRPRIVDRLSFLATSPPALIRLGGVLTLSAIIDTGVYEVGKHIGFREAEKGKIPPRLLRAGIEKHTPSDERMLMSQISPIPLTLKPLHPPTEAFIKPTPAQLAQLHRAIARTQSASTQLTV